jgi:hypothetical protein
LWELYYASIDGTLPNTSLIMPLSWKRNQSYTKDTPDYISNFDKSMLSAKGLVGDGTSGGLFGSLFTTLKWVLIGGGVIIAVGGGFYLVNSVKRLTGK